MQLDGREDPRVVDHVLGEAARAHGVVVLADAREPIADLRLERVVEQRDERTGVEDETGRREVGPGRERPRRRVGDRSLHCRLELQGRVLGLAVGRRGVRRHEQCGHLLGCEVDVREVVALLRDGVALLDLEGIGGDELDGDAGVAQHVLVAFEHPLRGGQLALLVGGDPLADLAERERAGGLEKQRGQVEQPFDRVHRAGMILPSWCGSDVGRSRASRPSGPARWSWR